MRQKLHVLGYIAGFFGVLLAIVALLRVGSTSQRLTDVREELLMVAQGIRQNDIRNLSTRIEALSADISKVSGDVRALTSDVQGARAEVSKIAKDLAALSSKVAAMDSARLEALAEELAMVSEKLAKIDEITRDLPALSTKLTQVSEALASIQAQIAGWHAESAEAMEQRVKGINERLAQLQERLAKLETRQAEVLTEIAAAKLRIGAVDAEDLFVRVFLPQVAAERSGLQAKAQEIQSLQTRYAQGQVKPDAYQQQYAKLQAEYLQAQVRVNMSMLEKMIASPGFADLRADLQNLRDQAKPLADQVEGLVEQAQVTILNYTDFFNQLQQLQAAFQQVDQLLTQVAAVKILEVTQQVAREQGYHLVLRTKDVIMYSQAPVENLTPQVETRLQTLFKS